LQQPIAAQCTGKFSQSTFSNGETLRAELRADNRRTRRCPATTPPHLSHASGQYDGFEYGGLRVKCCVLVIAQGHNRIQFVWVEHR
jgi:hypothetical protein